MTMERLYAVEASLKELRAGSVTMTACNLSMIAPFSGPFSPGGVSEEFLAAVKGASFAFVNKFVFVPDLRHLLGCHYLLLNVRSVTIAGQCRGRLPLTADEESAVFQSIARGRDPQSFSLAGGEVMMVRCRTSRVRHT